MITTPRFAPLAVSLVVLASVVRGQDAGARSVRTAPAPDWVKAYPVELGRDAPRSGVGGTWCVLSEWQAHRSSNTVFQRIAIRFITESGVQDRSYVKIEYEPAYQKLCVHKLVIHRAGKVLDRLPSQKFDVIKRETQHERQLYDGTLSALAVLEDVRVGDTLEYTYTITGPNPVLEGRFSTRLNTSWSVPVGHLRLRVVWDGDRKLAVKSFRTALKPRIVRRDATVEYEWVDDDIPAKLSDGDLPSWYEPWGRIYLSDWASWSEVVQWALRQYVIPETLPDELEREAARIAALASPAARIAAALRLVQDRFRYVGMLNGIHSHRPHNLETISRRRFGDCKDKSLLLTALLRHLGVEAYPAFVETDYRHTIADWLPSPSAFDHVVVLAVPDGRQHWLDATSAYQRGPLEKLYFPAYGRALVVRPGEDGLTKVSGNGFDHCRTDIIETFRLEDYAGTATLDVTTIFQGCDADRIRSSFATESREEIGKRYLSHYAKDYPRIESLAPVTFEDDELQNRVTVRESYRIENLWRPKEDNKESLEASFHARTLDAEIMSPATRVRTMPFDLIHPTRVAQTIEIWFPTKLDLTPDQTRVENPAFLFSFEGEPKGSLHRLKYRYRSRRSYVEAAATPDYLEDVARAEGSTGYLFSIPKDYAKALPADASADEDRGPLTPNWPILFVTVLGLLLSVVAAFFVARWHPRYTPLNLPPGTPSGIGGWLIIPLIGLVAAPFFHLTNIASSLTLTFDASTWRAIGSPGHDEYHPLWVPTVLTELSLGTVMLVFDLLLLVLFLRQKYTIPRLMMIFYAANLVSNVLLLAMYGNIPEFDSSVLGEQATATTRSGMVMLVWGTYFAISRRVKATFVRGVPASAPRPDG